MGSGLSMHFYATSWPRGSTPSFCSRSLCFVSLLDAKLVRFCHDDSETIIYFLYVYPEYEALEAMLREVCLVNFNRLCQHGRTTLMQFLVCLQDEHDTKKGGQHKPNYRSSMYLNTNGLRTIIIVAR